MDPEKSATAPPADWTDAKSSMGHAPPPPYFDNPHPGYPQPGPGFPPQPQVSRPAPGLTHTPREKLKCHLFSHCTAEYESWHFNFC